ncbi:MAG: lysylphosphatidylglycerol synthase domain-containing protein, partial [Acidimicrobiia bacterium]
MRGRATAGWYSAARIAASAVMLALLLPRIHLASLLPDTRHADTVAYVVLGVVVTLSGFALSAWRWQRVLGVLDVHSRLPTLLSHYLAGQFVGNFLPSTIGGDVLRVSRLSATAPGAASFASVILERLTGWIVLPLLTLVGLALHPSLLGLGMASRLALALSLGTLTLLAALLIVAGSPRLAGRFAATEGRTRFI